MSDTLVISRMKSRLFGQPVKDERYDLKTAKLRVGDFYYSPTDHVHYKITRIDQSGVWGDSVKNLTPEEEAMIEKIEESKKTTVQELISLRKVKEEQKLRLEKARAKKAEYKKRREKERVQQEEMRRAEEERLRQLRDAIEKKIGNLKKENKELIREQIKRINEANRDVAKIRSLGDKIYAPSYVAHYPSEDMNQEFVCVGKVRF